MDSKQQMNALLIKLSKPGGFDEIAKNIFEAADKNKNGTIEKSELKSCLELVAGELGFPRPSFQQIDSIFNQLDLDKNGKIDFNEFQIYVKQVLEKAISEGGTKQ